MVKAVTTSTWGEEERAAVLDVLDSGQYTMGPRVREFEEAYAAYCGTKYCVAVNSGSSAVLLMAAAWALRYPSADKPKVIVPALGWSTSYSPFQQHGFRLIFVDIDRHTLNYDLTALQRACSLHQPQVILAINVLGSPNEYLKFPKGIPVLEDNCEAMGATYQGKRTGSFGVMAAHSTYFSHHICTMEGGLVTTDDEYFYHMLLSLRSHGWTRHLPPKNALGAKVAPFHFILPGYNVRPTEIQGALGLAQLKKLPRLIEVRRENASRFPFQTQREIGESSWYGFAVYGDDRAAFADWETRPIIAGNWVNQPAIKHYDHIRADPLSNANWVEAQGLMVNNSGTELIEWPSAK